MNKYIKINLSNEVIDVFFEYQKNKFDGTEILLGNVKPPYKHKINNKSISDEFGNFIFTWDGIQIFEKSQTEIDATGFNDYKKFKIKELKNIILNNWPLEINKTSAQLKTFWDDFNVVSETWENKTDADSDYEDALVWLGL